MIVIGIVYKQRMLISDVIMENPFVNSAVNVIGLKWRYYEINVIKTVHCDTM